MANRARVLVVDDEAQIRRALRVALRANGYDVEEAETGEEALDAVATRPPDLVILDLGLPDLDGTEVCRRIREGGSDVAIFMVTARDEELDRVVGLDVGADDYLAKPFGLAELTARVRALLRRRGSSAVATVPAPAAPPELMAGFRVDETARRVLVEQREVPLSVKEFDVLALLAREPGAVVKRERLMEEVWDAHWFGSTKTLDVTVARLRQKLDEADSPAQVVTVRGVGFRLERRSGD